MAQNSALKVKEAVKSKVGLLIIRKLPNTSAIKHCTHTAQVACKANCNDIFERAEKFTKEYQDRKRDEIRYPVLLS